MKHFLLTISLLLLVSLTNAKALFQSPQDFVSATLGKTNVENKVIWLSKEMQQSLTKILGHKYPRLRIRYWQKQNSTVWILEEIGKEQPITVGIYIIDGEIQQLKVLIYRETRGDEVRHRFFTKQFDNIKLTEDNRLSRSIDGITGATLSVRALKKLSRMALWLSSRAESKSNSEH